MKIFLVPLCFPVSGPRQALVKWAQMVGQLMGLGLLLVAVCSCRTMPGQSGGLATISAPTSSDSLPPEVFWQPEGWSAAAGAGWGLVKDSETGQWVPAPAPLVAYGPWQPPGFAQPWPEDEYLRDGGDQGVQAAVDANWQVAGLEAEDTIAHYDTIDGQRRVEPSNSIHIYSPRFGSVRQVSNLVANEGRSGWANLYLHTKLTQHEIHHSPYWHKQHFALGRHHVQDRPVQYFGQLARHVLSTSLGPQGFQDRFMPFEDFQIIRLGQMEDTEKAELARWVQAAVVWAKDDTVAVLLNEQTAAALIQDESLVQVYVVHQPPANPKLRLVKVASTAYAEPGDLVDFTLRFDNVGNQPIQNVTILDNLSARLEYVADSAQCSLKAQFTVAPNEAGSQLLRWELAEPLQPGQGGIIRFRCRVR
ncbi:MAG: DUF11 domain-containing protein [Thermoguttaceae bacterium]|nr:DUF11 domain-containing protein [Thermoguttaceae bacterium]MDW8037023.1 DUF11 domain-containing protein [Thermoguttaceae bacterium]